MANANGWGGRRPGAGRKRKALTEKQAAGIPAEVLKRPVNAAELPAAPDYFTSPQAAEVPLRAEEIYNATIEWLTGRNVAQLINPQMVKDYSLNIARYIQCEEYVSKTGLTASRGSGGVCISPYVLAGQQYLKTANNL